MSRRFFEVLTLGVAGFGLMLPMSSTAQISDVCPASIFVQPTGVTQRPADNAVLQREYGGMHSSTHLQGERSTRKLAAGYWEPAFDPNDPVTSTLQTFHTFVTVVNPNNVSLNAEIRYRDRAGNLLQTNAIFLNREGQWNEPAIPLGLNDGLGSIEVVSVAPTQNLEFVASTLHHTFQIFNVGDPLPTQPGMTSMQQMQIEQPGRTQVYWGPVPTTNLLPAPGADILQGMTGLWWLINPTNQPNQVIIIVRSRNGLATSSIVTIPPNGSLLDRTFWDIFLQFYLNPTFNFDDDFQIIAISAGGLPLIGEGLMIDIFGPNLAPGMKFRWASTIMPNTPALRLVNPEFVSAPNAAGTNTYMGLMNIDSAGRDIGPVNIFYRDRNGVTVATDTINAFPANRMARLGPGLADSPNYPAGIFSGSVEIMACKPGLAGWTMRVNDDLTQPESLAKVWGEVLDGGNGMEPGAGFPVTIAGTSLIRKVATLDIVEPDDPMTPTFEQWPSYTTFLNESITNVGPYFYRFHDTQGTDISNYLPQPFAGLRFRDTSFTYEDGLNFVALPPMRMLTSGRTDHTTGLIRGIDAIGGNVRNIPWDEFIFPDPPVWNGPGDVVPPRQGQ